MVDQILLAVYDTIYHEITPKSFERMSYIFDVKNCIKIYELVIHTFGSTMLMGKS